MTPNSGKDQEWRQEAGYSYSGILAVIGVRVPVGLKGSIDLGDARSLEGLADSRGFKTLDDARGLENQGN